ncbi:MAG: RDD family protein [Bacteroidota bacterium]|nr:RDD family protein [Bacteroidota bacterium]
MELEGININTTQNVLITYAPAGVGSRLVGAILDFAFKVAYVVICAIIIAIINKLGADPNGGWIIVIVILAIAPLVFYNLLMEQFFNGQSLGKKIMKIKVVKLDGTQPQFGAYLIRWVLRIIDINLFNGVIALLTVALTEKSQRLGDMAAGTTVINLKQKVNLQNTILYRTTNDYKIVFNEVSKLSDKDVGIIKDVFDHCTRNSDYIGLKQLAVKIKQKMEVTTSMPDSQFIKVVLLDYSQYQFEK